MWENIDIDIDRHYTGVFQILDEPISGELIYNKQNGTILLSLIKEVNSKSFFGKSNDKSNVPIFEYNNCPVGNAVISAFLTGLFCFSAQREFYRTLKYDIIIFKNQEQFIVIYVE